MWNGPGHGSWQSGHRDGSQTNELLHSLHDSSNPRQFARFGTSGPRHYHQQQQHAFLPSGPCWPQRTCSHGGPHAGLPFWLSPTTQPHWGHATTPAGPKLENEQPLSCQPQPGRWTPSTSTELYAVPQAPWESWGRRQPSCSRRPALALPSGDVWWRTWWCR